MGLPESPIKNLILRNVSITAATGMVIQNAQIAQENIVVTPAAGEAVSRGAGVTINGK